MTVAIAENPVTEPVVEVKRTFPWEDLVSTNMVGNTEAASGLSSVDMLQAANLDWEVGIRPLWRKMSDGSFVQHPKQRETYRVDTEAPLGAVRSRYEVFNNAEAFTFGDELVSEGVGKWVVAGEQKGGARVFMVMKLGEGFEVLGDDKYETYLYIRTSHGDGTSVSASVIPFRLWCTNQNGAAIRSAKSTWSIPHTTTVKDRVEEARQALKLSMNYENEFRKLADQLAGIHLSEDKAKALIGSVIPERRARRDDMIGDIMSNYLTSATLEPFRHTGYGLLNGLTEYMDHLKTQRTANARFESTMHGEGVSFRNRLIENLQAIS